MGSRYIPIGWVLTGLAWTSLACHQMSNILHLSTSAVLANSLSFSHTMPSSSPNSVIPPLSFTNLLLLLLHFTIIPQPSHSCSIRLPTISNLGCLCASFHSPLTSLQASYIHQDLPHFPPPSPNKPRRSSTQIAPPSKDLQTLLQILHLFNHTSTPQPHY